MPHLPGHELIETPEGFLLDPETGMEWKPPSTPLAPGALSESERLRMRMEDIARQAWEKARQQETARTGFKPTAPPPPPMLFSPEAQERFGAPKGARNITKNIPLGDWGKIFGFTPTSEPKVPDTPSGQIPPMPTDPAASGFYWKLVERTRKVNRPFTDDNGVLQEDWQDEIFYTWEQTPIPGFNWGVGQQAATAERGSQWEFIMRLIETWPRLSLAGRSAIRDLLTRMGLNADDILSRMGLASEITQPGMARFSPSGGLVGR